MKWCPTDTPPVSFFMQLPLYSLRILKSVSTALSEMTNLQQQKNIFFSYFFLLFILTVSLGYFYSCTLFNTASSALSSYTPVSEGGMIEPRSRIHESTISLRFLCIILRILRLDALTTIFTLQTSFKPFLLGEGGEGEGVKFVSRVTVNSKEENS
jgi:hypothetical protein